MRLFILAAIYTAIAGTAIAADIHDLRIGDMRKLRVHETPIAVPETAFTREDGTTGTMAQYEGKIIVLNFWATWCAPCRKEMPHLSALQSEFGGEDFEVVTIATGRNDPMAMQKFLSDINVDNLPLHRDPRQKFARDMGVLGLPVTVILDRHGDEIARLQGDADWSSDSAKAIIAALLEE